jgi:predicted nucleotidyltransferase
VQPDDYRAFTAKLRARLAGDERVVGIVAVGSMAARDYEPDAWSDHDFFVITRPGEQEALRGDLGWLPDRARVALSFRETDHGLKVIYDDGHLIEFAVFDLDEIALAGVNRYRVLLDRGGVEGRTASVQTQPRPQQSDEFLFGMVVASALVAAGRARRGELLSAAFFVTWTLKHLTALLARTVPSPHASILDDLDSLRRFERAYPQLGAELAAIVRLAPDEAAAALLDVAERELRLRHPELAWRGLDAVRARLRADAELS